MMQPYSVGIKHNNHLAFKYEIKNKKLFQHIFCYMKYFDMSECEAFTLSMIFF